MRREEEIAREGYDAATECGSHDEELHEEPSAWDLQKRMRNLEVKKKRREGKLQRQHKEKQEQAEYIEEQKRRLATLQFEEDDTKEDIRKIDEQIASLSQLHAELTAARAQAHAADEQEPEGCQEDEEGAAAALHQVFEAMRNYGNIRSPSVRNMLAIFVEQMRAMHDQQVQGPPPETPPATGKPVEESPGRSPPPRSPTPLRLEAAPAQQSPASAATGTNEPGPTVQMVQEANAALASDEMWEDTKNDENQATKRKAEEVNTGAKPQMESKLAQARQRAPAICDRPAPYQQTRGRTSEQSCTRSPARSRGRKELVQNLQEKVEQQRQLTLG